MKRKDENIISGIGERGESFFLLFGHHLSFFLSSSYLIGKSNPHIPPIHLYPPKKKLSFPK